MKAFKIIIIVFIIAAFMLVLNTDIMAQCVMCKGAVNDKANSSDSNLGEGLNKGILYLMSFPYIIFGAIAFFWYKESRKKTGKPDFFQMLKNKFIGK